jgi:hypothetical protein
MEISTYAPICNFNAHIFQTPLFKQASLGISYLTEAGLTDSTDKERSHLGHQDFRSGTFQKAPVSLSLLINENQFLFILFSYS